ncbi:chaplin [Kitasatospora purpeofusca]|uniref:chaplin n=1 Tax=Kitasatospora purpeofusca TaxID=67352 RepID=UPI0033E401D6
MPDPHAPSGKANRAGATHNALVFTSKDVLGGNQIQIPTHIPLNVCASSINLVGTLNPAFGYACPKA